MGAMRCLSNVPCRSAPWGRSYNGFAAGDHIRSVGSSASTTCGASGTR
jgi:hypothetical protein